MIKGSRRDGSIGDISVLEGGMSNGMGGEPGAKAYEERQQQQVSAIMAGDHMNEMLAEGKALAAADTGNDNVAAAAPQKDYLGDAVPGNTGIDDRFNSGHYGAHVLSPPNGGKAITLPSLAGTVIYWNTQPD